MEKDINQILNLKEIDQLDSAILQFSQNTLLTKKLCASILIGIVVIILKITNNKFDRSIYISSFITLGMFWVIDSFSYYYQRKLRIRMSKIVKDLRSENNALIYGFGMPLTEEKASWFGAFFNSSQIFYLLGIIVTIVLCILNIAKKI